MTNRINTLAAALALTVATLSQAGAAEANEATQNFDMPTVIGAAYHDARVATNPAEVRRQGGFLVAEHTQWLPKAIEEKGVAGTFDVLAVIGAAYHDPRVALNAVEVRRQGGFATAGAVQWLPAAPLTGEARVEAVKLGAL